MDNIFKAVVNVWGYSEEHWSIVKNTVAGRKAINEMATTFLAMIALTFGTFMLCDLMGFSLLPSIIITLVIVTALFVFDTFVFYQARFGNQTQKIWLRAGLVLVLMIASGVSMVVHHFHKDIDRIIEKRISKEIVELKNRPAGAILIWEKVNSEINELEKNKTRYIDLTTQLAQLKSKQINLQESLRNEEQGNFANGIVITEGKGPVYRGIKSSLITVNKNIEVLTEQLSALPKVQDLDKSLVKLIEDRIKLEQAIQNNLKGKHESLNARLSAFGDVINSNPLSATLSLLIMLTFSVLIDVIQVNALRESLRQSQIDKHIAMVVEFEALNAIKAPFLHDKSVMTTLEITTPPEKVGLYVVGQEQ